VINALENIRQSIDLLERSTQKGLKQAGAKDLLDRAVHEMDDSITVLAAVGLHLDAVAHLTAAKGLVQQGNGGVLSGAPQAQSAIAELKKARDLIIEPS